MSKTGKKILKKWTTVLGACAMLFTVPMTAEAADPYIHDIAQSPITLSYDGDNACGDNCPGHEIRGKSIKNTITVKSGKHKILFDGVEIDLSNQGKDECAFDIAKGAEVEVALKDGSENSLISARNRAGIHVPDGAKLSISGDKGKLTAVSKENGAGIGGDAYSTGDGNAGEIIIEGGTIIATGGSKAAGIGGKGAKLQLNGGKITAEPGNGQATGVAGELSSEYGKEVVLTTKGSLQNAEKFNGVVWDMDKTMCRVYGDAVIGNSFVLEDKAIMVIPEKSSLTLNGKGSGFSGMKGEIRGEQKGEGAVGGKFIYNERPTTVTIAQEIQQRSVLTKDNIHIYDLIYDGTDLKDRALDIVNADKIDANIGWTRTIDGKPWEKANITDVGSYEVKYSHKIHGDIPVTVKVDPVDITHQSIAIQNIPKQTYTGEPLEPTVTVKFANTKLDPDKDYEVTYSNNTNPGTATVTVQGRAGGNVEPVTGQEKTATFIIEPAPIIPEGVTIDKDTFDYDGVEHKPAVTVEVEGKKLTEGTDYEVKYPDDLISAGKKTVTVTGLGNYGGTVTIEYEIQALPLKVTGAEADPLKREYDGTDKVSISVVNLSGILTGDEADVQVDTTDLKGIVDSADIGIYEKVLFENLTLTGAKAGNYTLETPEDEVELKEAVEIIQAHGPAAPTFKDVDVYSVSEKDEDTFVYTVEIADKIEGAEYEYRMDDGKWTDDNVFDKIEPESEHTFEAHTKWTENIDTGETGSTGKIVFKKLPQDPPKSFTLKYTLNEDKVTYTATIPEIENGEYSFSADGEYTEKNTKDNCVPNTEYTGYVRFAATAVYEASEPVSDTQITPMATVALPVITPDGGQFISSQQVEISCETAGAVIYYTTDGKNPTTSSEKYAGPFTVDSTTTVKAIAVKDGMKDSAMAAAQFVKASGDSVKSKVNIAEFTEASEIPEGLKDTEFNTAENVIVQLSRILTSQKGYTYDNIAYYDITLEISLDGENWEPATIDNFPKNGVSIVMPYPEGTGEKTNDFVVSHMFTETSERLGVTAGETEEPPVTKTEEGIRFTVKSTSPVAIAWKEAAQNTGNGSGNNNGTNNNGNNNGTDDNGTDNNGTDGNGTDNNGADANATNGTGANGTDANGTGANGTGTNGTGTNGTDGQSGAQKALSAILPKTGDPVSFIPWIALIAIAAIAIVTVIIKKRR